jgi:tetratricopeptide (TPR) repeat protein
MRKNIVSIAIAVMLVTASCSSGQKTRLNPDAIDENIKSASSKEAPLTYANIVVKPKQINRIKKYVTIGVPIIVGGVLMVAAPPTAPAVGTWIGTTFLGLKGIAATNAGLALLGGGAIGSHALATGMAGGTVVVTAGEALGYYALDAGLERVTAAGDNKYHKNAEKELGNNNTAMALRLYRESIENTEDILRSYYAIAIIEQKTKNYVGAASIFEKLSKYSKDSTLPLFHLALLKFADGETDKGIDMLQNAVDKEPPWDEPYVALYQTYLDKGEETKAFETLMAGVKLNPDSAALNYQSGIAFSNKSQWPTAISYYTTAIKNDKNINDVFLLRGLAFLKLDKKDEALDDLLTVDNRLKDETPFGVLLEIGRLYTSQGKRDDACKYLGRAKKLITANPQIAQKQEMLKVINVIDNLMAINGGGQKRDTQKPWWKVWG